VRISATPLSVLGLMLVAFVAAVAIVPIALSHHAGTAMPVVLTAWSTYLYTVVAAIGFLAAGYAALIAANAYALESRPVLVLQEVPPAAETQTTSSRTFEVVKHSIDQREAIYFQPVVGRQQHGGTQRMTFLIHNVGRSAAVRLVLPLRITTLADQAPDRKAVSWKAIDADLFVGLILPGERAVVRLLSEDLFQTVAALPKGVRDSPDGRRTRRVVVVSNEIDYAMSSRQGFISIKDPRGK
jgi:hypothetical protein